MTGKCKDCLYARFDADPKTGASMWQGRCLVDILSMKEGEKMKYHTVMQHFHCSNNRFQPRYQETCAEEKEK